MSIESRRELDPQVPAPPAPTPPSPPSPMSTPTRPPSSARSPPTPSRTPTTCALEHAERLTAPRGWEVVRLGRRVHDPGAQPGRPARAGRCRARGRPPAPAPQARRWPPSREGRRRAEALTPVLAAPMPRGVRAGVLPQGPPARAPRPLTGTHSGPATGPAPFGRDFPTLADFVKAYDVRGLVPDQLDADVARALGAAFAQVVAVPEGADAVVIGHDMRPSSPELSAGLRRRRGRAAASTSPSSAWPAPTASTTPAARSTCPARCSPPATTRPHTTASSCAAPARGRSARTPAWPRSATCAQQLLRRPAARRADQPADRDRRDRQRARRPRRLRRLPARPRRPRRLRPLKVVVDAGNGMAGHTVPAVLGTAAGLARAAARGRPAVLRARRHLPQPRGQPARPREPARPAGRRPPSTAPTSAWPSTATPTAASSSTSAASRSARARSPRWSPAARSPARSPPARMPPTSRHPQRDLLARGPRDHRRDAAPAPVRTRVGHSFIKAEMARHDAVFGGEHSRPLLLPRLLVRRHRHARRHARARRPGRAGRARCPS